MGDKLIGQIELLEEFWLIPKHIADDLKQRVNQGEFEFVQNIVRRVLAYSLLENVPERTAFMSVDEFYNFIVCEKR